VPTYDYECQKCGHTFELRRSFTDDSKAECPKCKGKSNRLFTPVPIIFKGAGFYVTDHKKPSPVGDSNVESPVNKTEAKSEGKSETKSEAKKETKSEPKKVAKVSGQ
jgi:putative FmdB family regulatory protein